MIKLGIVIWARHDAASLAIWCSDSKHLAFVPDASEVCEGGRPGQGDLVEIELDAFHPSRLCRKVRLRQRSAGLDLVDVLKAFSDERHGADILPFPGASATETETSAPTSLPGCA